MSFLRWCSPPQIDHMWSLSNIILPVHCTEIIRINIIITIYASSMYRLCRRFVYVTTQDDIPVSWRYGRWECYCFGLVSIHCTICVVQQICWLVIFFMMYVTLYTISCMMVEHTAVNGEVSTEVLKLPNENLSDYLKQQYSQQSSKLRDKVFVRSS